jgi:hypothetical protein
MNTHDLAQLLLSMPDMPAYTRNQTYDETTWDEVVAADPTDMTVTEYGTYAAEYFNPPLVDAKRLRVVVIE